MKPKHEILKKYLKCYVPFYLNKQVITLIMCSYFKNNKISVEKRAYSRV